MARVILESIFRVYGISLVYFFICQIKLYNKWQHSRDMALENDIWIMTTN